MTEICQDHPLPEDITIGILLRLPFTSILECKRVSKQWKNLINDTKFHKLYRNKSVVVFREENAIYCLLIRQDNKNPGYPSLTVHRLPIWLRLKSMRHQLLSGWSNGMVCFKEAGSPFYVYNLFTGASYDVAEAPLQQEHSHRSLRCCGFGYDHYDDDYKIFVVYKCRCGNVLNTVKNEANGLFWVYSLRNRRWESYHGFPYAAYVWSIRQQPYCFDGVLHWVLKTKEEPNLRVIVTYDLHTRRFGEISVPSIAYGKACLEETVSELDGRLCFMKNTRLHDGYDIEVYCIGPSWTKFYNFYLPLGYIFTVFWLGNIMLCECGDGTKAVLLVNDYDNMLFWYDINKNVLESTLYLTS